MPSQTSPPTVQKSHSLPARLRLPNIQPNHKNVPQIARHDPIFSPENGPWGIPYKPFPQPICRGGGAPSSFSYTYIITSNFLAASTQFPNLPIYSSILSPDSPYLSSLQTCLQSRPQLNPLLPIKPDIPPWLYNCPTIRVDLANLPKQDDCVYRALIAEIMAEYPNHTVCFTDGSRTEGKTGYAYSIGHLTIKKRMRNSASVFSAELSAIHACLIQLTRRPPHQNYILLSDSLSSLTSLKDNSSSNPIVQRILLTLHTLTSINSTITFIWIPGHVGLPGHEKVDQAAKESTHLPRITDPTPSPAYDLKNYYRSSILTTWHGLWANQ